MYNISNYKKIFLLMLVVSSLKAQNHTRDWAEFREFVNADYPTYQCIEVGEKGLFRKYKEVFKGRLLVFIFNRLDKKKSLIEWLKTDSLMHLTLVSKKNGDYKFHTDNNKVMYANKLADRDGNVHKEIHLNFIQNGFIYDKSEYFNCFRIDDREKVNKLLYEVGLK